MHINVEETVKPLWIRTGFLPGKAAPRLFVAEVYTYVSILLLYYNIIIINTPCTENII